MTISEWEETHNREHCDPPRPDWHCTVCVCLEDDYIQLDIDCAAGKKSALKYRKENPRGWPPRSPIWRFFAEKYMRKSTTAVEVRVISWPTVWERLMDDD